ncbi:hypothetical protein ACEPPN_005011 [Leptodophora sp. 'Broadleaf-Isolate-01']
MQMHDEVDALGEGGTLDMDMEESFDDGEAALYGSSLGSAAPVIPSYLPITHCVYEKMANVERRLFSVEDLTSHPPPASLPGTNETIMEADTATVRNWAKIVTGFVMEWLDMIEVWPEE